MIELLIIVLGGIGIIIGYTRIAMQVKKKFKQKLKERS